MYINSEINLSCHVLIDELRLKTRIQPWRYPSKMRNGQVIRGFYASAGDGVRCKMTRFLRVPVTRNRA